MEKNKVQLFVAPCNPWQAHPIMSKQDEDSGSESLQPSSESLQPSSESLQPSTSGSESLEASIIKTFYFKAITNFDVDV